jgi:uncharacterized protein (DUF427 family)
MGRNRIGDAASLSRRALKEYNGVMNDDIPDWIAAAREHWEWRGHRRPPFAESPGPGQRSVWDFPRPPCLASDPRDVTIHWRGIEIARTTKAICVLETAHPPSFYIPWNDVQRALLQPAPGGSFCEWKGPASYWSVVDGERSLPGVAWSYPKPLAGAEALAACVAFYPHELDCHVAGAKVLPQPGGFYGGWITPDLSGPFKGKAGSSGW